MRTLKITDGDFVVDGNSWEEITGVEAVRQRISHRLRMWKGDWFLDSTEGVDWIGIFEKPFSLRRMKAEILGVLKKDEMVEQVEDMEFIPDFSNRSLKINITVLVDGEKVNISEEMGD